MANIYYIGTTGPPWQFTITDDQGNALNVSGGTFTLFFRSATNNEIKFTGLSSFTVVDAANGVIQYQLDGNDLGTIGPGFFEIVVEAVISGLTYIPPQVPIIEVQSL
jgi:hypothetical protein